PPKGRRPDTDQPEQEFDAEDGCKGSGKSWTYSRTLPSSAAPSKVPPRARAKYQKRNDRKINAPRLHFGPMMLDQQAPRLLRPQILIDLYAGQMWKGPGGVV